MKAVVIAVGDMPVMLSAHPLSCGDWTVDAPAAGADWIRPLSATPTRWKSSAASKGLRRCGRPSPISYRVWSAVSFLDALPVFPEVAEFHHGNRTDQLLGMWEEWEVKSWDLDRELHPSLYRKKKSSWRRSALVKRRR